jgi:CBS domain containing-hemolysin-like protein
MLIVSPLRLMIFIARPFLAALEGPNTLVLQILGVKPQSEEEVTQEEIRRILSAGLSAGVLLSVVSVRDYLRACHSHFSERI